MLRAAQATDVRQPDGFQGIDISGPYSRAFLQAVAVMIGCVHNGFSQINLLFQFHLIGDAAYTLHHNMMVPYKSTASQGLTANQEAHNTIHSGARIVVERSFADLKRRWRKLLLLDNDIHLAVPIAMACCVLHNMCVLNDDIMDSVNNQNLYHPFCGTSPSLVNSRSGVSKRNAISQIIG